LTIRFIFPLSSEWLKVKKDGKRSGWSKAFNRWWLLIRYESKAKKKLFELFQREPQLAAKGESMRKVNKGGTKRAAGGVRVQRELAALSKVTDEQIDSSEVPELPPNAWKNAVRGKFYRPVKKAVSIRLDADVLAWLKHGGEGYQTRANSILRQRMLKELKKDA
jgi:uncharacterized protein (DUF4415 family)